MKKLGFTLAEVLITLVIIGVIAAMTVPTLMNNTQGKENATAFKKAISSMNQALTMEYALEGNTAATLDPDNDVNGLYTAMKKRTNVINEVDWTGTAAGVAAKQNTFATADGIIYSIPNAPEAGTACSGETTDSGQDVYGLQECGIGAVDVNGTKGPNQQVASSDKPQDIFLFKIYETKVLPGTSADTVEAAIMYDKKGVTTKSSES